MYRSLIWLTLLLVGPTALAAEVQGRLAWAQRVELSTPVSGQIARVLVDVGDRVEEGEALLELDPRPFEARASRARASLASAEEALAEAQRERERAEELFERQVMSTHEVELVQVALSRAEAQFEQAHAALRLAELDLEYATVRAPYDAVVLARHAEPGQTVVTRLQSQPLLVLARGDRLLAQVQVATAALRQLQEGQELTVRIDGRDVPGVVARLGLEPQEQEGEIRYTLDVAIPAVEAGVARRAGEAVTVLLP